MLKNNIFLTVIFINVFLTLSIACSDQIHINLFKIKSELAGQREFKSECNKAIEHELLYEYTNARPGMKLIKRNGVHYIHAPYINLQIDIATYVGLIDYNVATKIDDQSAQYYKNFRNAMFLHKYRMSQPRPIGIRK